MPTNGTPQCADAADDRHQGRLDRDIEAERGVRIDEVDVLDIEGSGERGEKCADQIDVALDPQRVDADRFGGVLVLADGDEIVSHPRALDPPGDREPDRQQRQRDVVVRRLAFELHHQRSVAEIGHGRPLGAPRKIAKFQKQQHQDLRRRDRGDGEIRSAQPKAQRADRKARQHGHDAAGQHSDPRRNAKSDEQDRRCVGAQAEIGGMTERQLLGVTAHEVPGDANEGEQQYPDEDVDGESVSTPEAEARARPRQAHRPKVRPG